VNAETERRGQPENQNAQKKKGATQRAATNGRAQKAREVWNQVQEKKTAGNNWGENTQCLGWDRGGRESDASKGGRKKKKKGLDAKKGGKGTYIDRKEGTTKEQGDR